MANLRIVADNAADSATIVASASAGALTPDNLQVDEKAKVWRSTEATATLTLTWSVHKPIDSVALLWTNFSSEATVRVRAYINPSDGAAALDETIQPDPPQALDALAWGVDALGRSGAQCSGSPQHAQLWLSSCIAARKAVLDIEDKYSPDGYLEASRIAAGARWELAGNMSYGYQLQWVDRAKPERAESGDARIERLSRYRRVEIKLDFIESKSDRDRLIGIAANGLGQPLWLCGWPDRADDVSVRQIGAMWGAFASEPAITHPMFGNWASSPVFEEFA